MKNNKGFTLVELMIASGLVGIIGLITVSTLRTSRRASDIVVVGSEVSTLKSLIVAQLVNPEACSKTFPNGTDVARTNISILNQIGSPVASVGTQFGSTNEFQITKISTSSVAASQILNIFIEYQLRFGVSHARKQINSFTIDLFVNKEGTKITGCFADIAGAIRKGIKYSCLDENGNAQEGAMYDPNLGLYGRCTHNLPVIKDNSGTVVTSLCPTGQYLVSVSAPGGVLTLQCKSLQAGPCTGNWEYLNGFDPISGTGNCIKLSTLYGAGKVIATSTAATGTNTYIAIDLNCPTNQVLRSISTSGVKDCVPRTIVKVCNVGEYVSDVTSDGSGGFKAECKPFVKTTTAACPNGQYLKAINADGSIPAGGCSILTIPANCPANQVMHGLDSNGNAVCVSSY